MFDAVIKVGGSLYGSAELRRMAAGWMDLAAEYHLLLLPGGGPFADRVRAADLDFRLSAATAHWMAILAMDQYACLLADLTPRATLVRDLTAAVEANDGGRLAILAPSTLLLALDPLPHGWHVTSDSIAAWLAGYVQAQRLILLKSLAGEGENPLPRLSSQDLAGGDIVDPYFSQALPPGLNCWFIDGRQPGRLAELLRQGWTVGTQVVNPPLNPADLPAAPPPVPLQPGR